MDGDDSGDDSLTVARGRSSRKKKLVSDEDSSSKDECNSSVGKKCGSRQGKSKNSKEICSSSSKEQKNRSSDEGIKNGLGDRGKIRRKKTTCTPYDNEGTSSSDNNFSIPKASEKKDQANTRSSARLQMKKQKRGTLKLPVRRKLLEKVTSSTSSSEDTDVCKTIVSKRHVQVNNFFKERSTYNADVLDPYSSEGDQDDFLVADDDVEESETDVSENETPRKKRKSRVKRRRRREVHSSSSDECSTNQKAGNAGKKCLRIDESESSGEPSDIELNLSSRRERNESMVLRSDSEEDCKNSSEEFKSLPRRRNKEKEKFQKAAADYKRIRDIASSKLPLDRRRFLEKQLENEVSSDIEDQFDDEIQIHGVNDQGNDDELTLRDSDKEFIVYSSESEDERSQLKVEDELKSCLEKLRKCSRNFPNASLLNESGMADGEANMVEDQLKYKRIKIECESEDEMDNMELKELFDNLRKQECDNEVITRLIRDNKELVNKGDNHEKRPLHVASISGNADAVSVLLANGADASAVDESKLPSIAYAAYCKHPKVLKLLLRQTNLAWMHRILHGSLSGMSVVHLVLLDRHLADAADVEARQVECLRVIKACNSAMYYSLLEKADTRHRKPILIAIGEGQTKCVEVLLEKGEQLRDYRTELAGTAFHYAVMHASNWGKDRKASILRLLSNHLNNLIDIPDRSGFTPIMYAAEIGDAGCIEELIKCGASVDLQDNHGTSALHLAAAIGSTECVKLLLASGHPVDILDDCGWPPLLYANFQSCESCVVELMKAKPKQLFVLSSLLKNCDQKQKEKNMQVIKSTILSLANQDSYYQIFNDFIRENPALLDEFNFGLFSTNWKAILDFDNKHNWFRRRIKKRRRPHASFSLLTVGRESVLECAMCFFEGSPSIDILNLEVEFQNEPGMCTGPKKEFLACLCNRITRPDMRLFTRNDDQQYSPTPLSFFADVLWNRSHAVATEDVSSAATSPVKSGDATIHAVLHGDKKQQSLLARGRMQLIQTELKEKLRVMTFIGKFVAACIADGWYINLQLSKPFIKQILGQPLCHPDDLQSVDLSLYNGAVKSTLESSVDCLELPSSISCSNPWLDSCVEEIVLNKAEALLTDENKNQFVVSVSKFKLSDSIDKEVRAFRRGFLEEVSHDLISIFTAGEFSLLMNGIQNIDVHDWKNNTEYAGWDSDDSEIVWFWRTVEGLKQEEKALLLKFSTGSPCVPIGGFKNLEGLGGKRCFTISRKPEERNTIPTAATCFNLLRLSSFTSEKELREKVLIALRHGSEGFAFG